MLNQSETQILIRFIGYMENNFSPKIQDLTLREDLNYQLRQLRIAFDSYSEDQEELEEINNFFVDAQNLVLNQYETSKDLIFEKLFKGTRMLGIILRRLEPQ